MQSHQVTIQVTKMQRLSILVQLMMFIAECFLATTLGIRCLWPFDFCVLSVASLLIGLSA